MSFLYGGWPLKEKRISVILSPFGFFDQRPGHLAGGTGCIFLNTKIILKKVTLVLFLIGLTDIANNYIKRFIYKKYLEAFEYSCNFNIILYK